MVSSPSNYTITNLLWLILWFRARACIFWSTMEITRDSSNQHFYKAEQQTLWALAVQSFVNLSLMLLLTRLAASTPLTRSTVFGALTKPTLTPPFTIQRSPWTCHIQFASCFNVVLQALLTFEPTVGSAT